MANLIRENLNQNNSSDIIRNIITTLEKSEFEGSIDLRVTYTHDGVKANLSYFMSSEKQKKPFKTLDEAIKNCLTSYLNNLKHNRKYSYEEGKKENLNPPYLKMLTANISVADELIYYTLEALEFLK